jgi:hypothetical protein
MPRNSSSIVHKGKGKGKGKDKALRYKLLRRLSRSP